MKAVKDMSRPEREALVAETNRLMMAEVEGPAMDQVTAEQYEGDNIRIMIRCAVAFFRREREKSLLNALAKASGREDLVLK